jgi:hypothetical protein
VAGESGIRVTDAAIVILNDAVSASDSDDLERWLIGYNPMLAAGVYGRVPAGAHLDDGDPDGGVKRALALPDRLPGVQLPPLADLAGWARSAPLAAQLAALAASLGPGHPVTRDGELRPADAAQAAQWLGITTSQLRYLWEFALAGYWVEITDSAGGQAVAVPGESAAEWESGEVSGAGPFGVAEASAATLRSWSVTLAAVLSGTMDIAVSLDPSGLGTLNFQGLGSLAALKLFLARGEGGLRASRVRDLIMNGAIGDLAWTRVRRQLDARAQSPADPVRVLLDQLAALRAVESSPAGEGSVRLTALGLYALAAELVAAGVDVPVVPLDPATMTTADLVALHGGVLPAEFEAISGRWVAVHGGGQRAAVALLSFAADAAAADRLVAVGVVRGLGEAAAPAWREGLKRPEIRPYARIELTRLATELADNTMPLVLQPSPDDLTWLATDLLALACGEDDPDPDLIAAQFREAVPAGDEEWIFKVMSMGSHPDVVRVLTVLGKHHPDKRVARDARKAAHEASARRAAGHRAARMHSAALGRGHR